MTDSEPSPDDQSWLRQHRWLVVAGIVVVVLVAVAGTQYQDFDYRLHPERKAYDDGSTMGALANVFAGPMSCEALSINREEMVHGRFALEIQNAEATVLDAAKSARTKKPGVWEPEHDRLFLAGFWDKMMEACPGLDNVRSVTGRP